MSPSARPEEVRAPFGLAYQLGILIPADREALLDQYGQLIRALQALISSLRALKPEAGSLKPEARKLYSESQDRERLMMIAVHLEYHSFLMWTPLLVRRFLFRWTATMFVWILAASAVAISQPCDDDLLVEMGISRELCVESPATSAPSSSEAPSLCPCVCHFGVSLGDNPTSSIEQFVAINFAPFLPLFADPDPALIPHPPRA